MTNICNMIDEDVLKAAGDAHRLGLDALTIAMEDEKLLFSELASAVKVYIDALPEGLLFAPKITEPVQRDPETGSYMVIDPEGAIKGYESLDPQHSGLENALPRIRESLKCGASL